MSQENTPAQWVLGAARELARRSTQKVPLRWLNKLEQAFGFSGTTGPALQLPDFAWNEPSLLGELLLSARRTQAGASAEREGRAGRVSVGSVYTPAAVARRIVSELPAASRHVVDPACGAGVFLLEAFLHGYRRRLDGGAHAQKAAEAVLTQDLSGIDIDAQALAVAEFSLRLVALHNSGLDADVPLDLRLADALEPLTNLDGGCECVVGNPPFVEGRGLSPGKLEELRQRFRCAASGKINLFAVFVERALSLLKDDGVMALVLPATFQRNTRYLALRELLLEQTLESIQPLERDCFPEYIIETVVLRVRKRTPPKGSRVKLLGGDALQTQLPLGPALRFCDRISEALRRQIRQMEHKAVPLSKCFEVRDGISTGFQPLPQRLLGVRNGDNFVSINNVTRRFDPNIHRKIIDGGEFSAFSRIDWAGRYVEYDKAHEHTPPHPGKPFNCQLRERAIFDRPEKLLTRQTARGLIATVDRERYFVRNSVHVTYARDDGPINHDALSLDALCACLNSRLYTDYLLAVTGESGDIFPQVHIADLKQLPILPALLRTDGEMARLGRHLLALRAAGDCDDDAIAQKYREVEELLLRSFA